MNAMEISENQTCKIEEYDFLQDYEYKMIEKSSGEYARGVC